MCVCVPEVDQKHSRAEIDLPTFQRDQLRDQVRGNLVRCSCQARVDRSICQTFHVCKLSLAFVFWLVSSSLSLSLSLSVYIYIYAYIYMPCASDI